MTTATVTETSATHAEAKGYPVGGVRFDWVYAVLCCWMIGGLYLDGWAHSHGNVDDVFFTPWHAVLYSGVGVMGVFLFVNQWRNMDKGFPMRRALPQGYGLSLVGVGLFLLGGGLDFVWHTLFGIEVDVETLLSPTHLLLATAGCLILTGTIRAVWNREAANARGWQQLGPVVISATAFLSLLTFFTQYVSPFVNTYPAQTTLIDLGRFSDLYAMNADGSGQTRLTSSTEDSSWFGVWSPDGEQIVFTLSNVDSQDESALYVMKTDGTGLRQLTDMPGSEYIPNWSPDGTQVVFVSFFDGTSDIYVVDADGSNPVNLTNSDVPDYGPAWSPDGTLIVFTSNPSGVDYLYVMDADGGNVSQLVMDGQFNWGVAWSPDGSQIAFNSTRDNNTDIYVINADGTGLTRLTDHPGNDYSPAWSPDGEAISFTSWRDEVTDVYRMKADGSEVVNLTNNHVGSSEFPQWSPDGEKILYTVSGRSTLPDTHYTDSLGVTSVLIPAALLMGVILLLVQRWELPFGTFTLMMTANALLMGVFSDQYLLALCAIPAGLVADLLYARLRPSPDKPRPFYAFAFLTPVLYFGAYFLALQLTAGIGWTVHLWLGSIFIAGIVGLFLALLVVWSRGAMARLSGSQ